MPIMFNPSRPESSSVVVPLWVFIGRELCDSVGRAREVRGFPRCPLRFDLSFALSASRGFQREDGLNEW